MSVACVPGLALGQAGSDRIALVIGNAAYTKPQALPGCTVSAEVIGEKLRALGFDVILRTDTSNGVMGAALSDFAQRVSAARNPSVAAYFCGYVASFDDRLFLLPVGAVIERRSDVLTQGIPLQSLLDVAGSRTRAALFVVDTFGTGSMPAEAASELSASTGARHLGGGQLLISAVETSVGTTATPVAQALAARLSGPTVSLAGLASGLRQDLAGSGVTLAIAGEDTNVPLVAPPATVAESTALQPSSPAPAKEAPPPPNPPAPGPGATPSATPAPTVTGPMMPDEAHYDVQDRRLVQSALKDLGYYDGNVDGVFGPETRAAIRRYQHELGQPMTGILTPAEATRLVAGSATANPG